MEKIYSGSRKEVLIAGFVSTLAVVLICSLVFACLNIPIGTPVIWMYYFLQSIFGWGPPASYLLIAILLFPLFCVLNWRLSKDMNDVDFESAVKSSREVLLAFTLLSSAYYLYAIRDTLKYQGLSNLIFDASLTLCSFFLCYSFFWKKVPRSISQLLLANSLLFFSVFASFFPWLGEVL